MGDLAGRPPLPPLLPSSRKAFAGGALLPVLPEPAQKMAKEALGATLPTMAENLRQAARIGDTEEVYRIIDEELPQFGVMAVNYRENGGFTALDCAAANGHTEIVRLLARLGGSHGSNTPDYYSGMTPLLWAAQGGHWECIAALCENYSDLDVCDKYGQTALHIACREGHKDLSRVLLENGCSPNIRDHTLGKTPLHMVAGLGAMDMCELLCVNGADVNVVDNEGHTPIYIASSEGHQDIKGLLLRYSKVQSEVTERMSPPLRPDESEYHPAHRQ